LIDGVIQGTGLKERDPVSTFFGNWTWDYSDVPPEDWLKAQPVLMERVKSLYRRGLIRYGSW